MPAGLQVFDESGAVTLDLTDRITRILGQTTTAGGANVSGSITHAGFLEGEPWWVVVLSDFTADFMPKVSISGSVLSWSSEGVWRVNPCTIIYGVY